ncbi:MAG: molybdopterin molybdotransferase, partial [Halothiobacillaceae bacterium]
MSDPCYPPHAALLTVDEALARLLAHARPVTATLNLSISTALGHVLAEAINSPLAVPPWDNSAMDGFAVAHRDLLQQGQVTLPISQRIAAGEAPAPHVGGTAARIFTGAPLPSGADTVVPQEACEYN